MGLMASAEISDGRSRVAIFSLLGILIGGIIVLRNDGTIFPRQAAPQSPHQLPLALAVASVNDHDSVVERNRNTS